MQTLADSLKPQQTINLHLESTPLESLEGVASGTLVSSSFSSEDLESYDYIRPITPEITYPYPLYKTDDYYNAKRLAMKPNQVSRFFIMYL